MKNKLRKEDIFQCIEADRHPHKAHVLSKMTQYHRLVVVEKIIEWIMIKANDKLTLKSVFEKRIQIKERKISPIQREPAVEDQVLALTETNSFMLSPL